MAIKTSTYTWVHQHQSSQVKNERKIFRRTSLCMLPFIWPHLGMVGCTLLTGLMICMVATHIILADYKCPKCGMQLDYNRSLDEPQMCFLCGKVVA